MKNILHMLIPIFLLYVILVDLSRILHIVGSQGRPTKECACLRPERNSLSQTLLRLCLQFNNRHANTDILSYSSSPNFLRHETVMGPIQANNSSNFDLSSSKELFICFAQLTDGLIMTYLENPRDSKLTQVI